jgi:hypothetical protein
MTGRGRNQENSAPRLFPQDPTGCLNTTTSRTTDPIHTPKDKPQEAVRGPLAVADRSFTSVSANEHPTNTLGWCGLLTHFRGKVLLRKEVIQPHLPVRLPCYDFVPIASPTFDGSLPYGLGHRLRVLPTFVT